MLQTNPKLLCWLKRFFILLIFMQHTQALCCRFNVRDVGFVDLGSKPYNLYIFIGNDMPNDVRDSLQSICVATFYDTNIKFDLISVSEALKTSAKDFIPPNFKGEFPVAVLVAPDHSSNRKTLNITLHKEGEPITKTAWDALESLVDSPRRNAILEKVFDCYGVIMVVGGENADENKRIRTIAERVASETAATLSELEKEIQNPPVIEVITTDQFEKEKAFLWSLNILKKTQNPKVVILYGRGRKIGPVLEGNTLNEAAITAILSTIGLNCECGLDRKWMQGAMVPLKWDKDRKQKIAKQLGFNPESPEIRIEMSQILAKGSAGEGAHRSKIIGDTLDELLTGYRTGGLSAGNTIKTKEETDTNENSKDIPKDSKISLTGWMVISIVSILLIGGSIPLVARKKNIP